MNYSKTFTNAALWHAHNITGRGVTIAVVDTGAHPHPDLTLLNPSTDENGHGTHVAGIAAGHTYGVAPDAVILPVKITNANGYATGNDMINGLEYLINWRKTHSERLVVNISMSMTHVPLILDKINELVSLDVPVCVAACNDGGEKSAIAEYDAPIVVGNLATPTRLHPTSTCWGEDTDCAVLGTDIYSCWKNGKYRLLSGTSMATPAVSGMMALILSRWPDISEQKAYEYLMSLGDKYIECESGHHKIFVPMFEEIRKEKEMRETKFISGIKDGYRAIVYDTATTGKKKVGNVRNGEKVLVLGYEGNYALITKEPHGYIPKKYLVDTEPVDEEDDPKAYPTGVQRFTDKQKDVKLSEHFTVGDFWSNPKYEWIELDTQLADIWEKFYMKFGEKPRLRNKYVGTSKYEPVVSAGFRNPDIDWSGSKTSKHCDGTGVDFEIPGVPAYELAQYAETLSEIGGIGHYYTTSEPIDKEEHIHIDTREREGSAKWGHQGKTSGCNIPTFGGVYAAIKKGHEGVAVRIIQAYLKSLGYYTKSLDGDFGDGTEKALKSWQRDKLLDVDGVYGKGSNKVAKLFNW